MKFVYTDFSKKLFYFRMQISVFVLSKEYVPLNPFMIFEYFLVDKLDRKLFYEANASLVKRADELWVFGEISDGVFAEIEIAKKMEKTIKYFEVVDSKILKKISEKNIKLEKES